MHLIEGIDKVDINDNPISTDDDDNGNKSEAKDSNMSKKKKLNIFISYSHKDAEWLDRLEVHLKGLSKYYNEIDAWDDRRIKSSHEWHKEIEKALLASNIDILLVSADFIASDYIHNNELKPLLDKAKEKEVKIIQYLLDQRHSFTKADLINTRGQITQRRHCQNVVNQIRNVTSLI